MTSDDLMTFDDIMNSDDLMTFDIPPAVVPPSVAMDRSFDQLMSEFHHQIHNTLKGCTPAAMGIMETIFPAVTNAMKKFLKDELWDRSWVTKIDDITVKADAKENDMSKAPLASRAGLPSTTSCVKWMGDSIFCQILESEVLRKKTNYRLIRDLFEAYDAEKDAFLIGTQWCVLCEHEIAFLLGIKAEGEDPEKSLGIQLVDSKPGKKQEMKLKAELPDYFVKLATSAKIDLKETKALLIKSSLDSMLTNTNDADENKESLRKLTYFFLLNFFLLPKSILYGRHMFFKCDINKIEKANWPKVIQKFVIKSARAYNPNSATKQYLEFYPSLLEAWFYYRTTSLEKDIEDNPDKPPIALCFGKSGGTPFSACSAKSKCSHCVDTEESLCEKYDTISAAAAMKMKRLVGTFSISYESLLKEAGHNIAIQMLKHCLASAKQALEDEEEVVREESDEQLLDSMKDEICGTASQSNWAWVLLKALATVLPNELIAENLEERLLNVSKASETETEGAYEVPQLEPTTAKPTATEPTEQPSTKGDDETVEGEELSKKQCGAKRRKEVSKKGDGNVEGERKKKTAKSALDRLDHGADRVLSTRLRSR